MESCYFCGESKVVAARLQRAINYDQKVFTFYYCKSCYGYSLFPKLSELQISDLYSINYVENFKLENSEQELNTWNKFLRLDMFLANYRSSEGSIFFDYGCGADPATFSIARRNGLVPLGMEFSADIREVVTTKTGVKMYSREEFVATEERFDKIFLGDVIEHLINPDLDLLHIKSKLNPGGILIAQGPLQGARTLTHLIVRMFSVISPSKVSNFPPYHVSLAHRKSMQELLKSLGFRDIKIECTEIDWPAPTRKEFVDSPSLRGLTLLLIKGVDKLLAKFFRSYGSRYFLVAGDINDENHVNQ
jgi:hypothetical protein